MKLNSEFVSAVSAGVKEHVPEILTGIGLAGFFTSLALTVKATKRSEKKIFREERLKGRPLTKKETFQTCWKEYILAGIVTATSTATIIAATVMYRKKVAGIAAICTLAESALLDYKEEAAKILNEEDKAQLDKNVEERAAQRIENAGQMPIYPMNCGNYLQVQPFFDLYCGRPFYASEADIIHARDVCNEQYIEGLEVRLNDFYSELGLDPVDFGEDRVWHATYETGMIELMPFGAYRSNAGVVYATMNFSNPPKELPKYR